MSITHHMSEMNENPFGLSAAGHLCFHCGEFLEDPAVMWSGNDGQTIYFHGPCFLDWMPRIMRDALDLKYAAHPCRHRATEESRG